MGLVQGKWAGQMHVVPGGVVLGLPADPLPVTGPQVWLRAGPASPLTVRVASARHFISLSLSLLTYGRHPGQRLVSE